MMVNRFTACRHTLPRSTAHHRSSQERHGRAMGMDLSPGALIELEQDPVLAELVRDWDFSPGKKFQAEVLRKFSSSVHHTSSSPDGSFFLLVVFRRFLFRLTEDSIAMALHCYLGGTPAGFHVSFQKERHFRFSVASKERGAACSCSQKDHD